MSNGKHRVETLPQAAAWIAQHGGEIDVKWEHQESLNKKMESTLDRIEIRISSLNTRIAWGTGAAVALGGVLTLAFRAAWP